MTYDPDSTPVFDSLDLLAFWNQQRAVAEKVLAAFIRSKNSYLSDMSQALLARDLTAVRFSCHKLTGSAATVRAGRVAQISEEIRAAAIADDYDTADRDFTRLQEAMIEFMTAIGQEFPALQEKTASEVQLG